MNFMKSVGCLIVCFFYKNKSSMMITINGFTLVSNIEKKIYVLITLGSIKELNSLRFTNLLRENVKSIGAVDLHINKVIRLSFAF